MPRSSDSRSCFVLLLFARSRTLIPTSARTAPNDSNAGYSCTLCGVHLSFVYIDEYILLRVSYATSSVLSVPLPLSCYPIASYSCQQSPCNPGSQQRWDEEPKLCALTHHSPPDKVFAPRVALSHFHVLPIYGPDCCNEKTRTRPLHRKRFPSRFRAFCRFLAPPLLHAHD